MKRITEWVLLLAVLTVVLTVPAAADGIAERETALETTVQTDGWQLDEWWREEVMPNLIAYLGMGAVILAELFPVIRGVKRSGGKFEQAAATVQAVSLTAAERDEAWKREKNEFMELFAREREAHAEQMRQYEEKLLAMQEEHGRAVREFVSLAKGYGDLLGASETRLAEMLRHIESSSDKTEKMVYLGFSNTGEMVKNGCARRIAEVEEEGNE